MFFHTNMCAVYNCVIHGAIECRACPLNAIIINFGYDMTIVLQAYINIIAFYFDILPNYGPYSPDHLLMFKYLLLEFIFTETLILIVPNSEIEMNPIIFTSFLLFSTNLVITTHGAAIVEGEEYRNYDGYKVYHATPKDTVQVGALNTFMADLTDLDGIQFWEHYSMPAKTNVIFVSPSGEPKLLQFLLANQIPHQIALPDYGLQMRDVPGIVEREKSKLNFLMSQAEEEFNLGHYHPYDAIVQHLQSLAKSNPEFANYTAFGKSFEGREMAMLKLGYPGADKPIFLLDAGIHAREWIAPATALHVINTFINEPEWHSLLKRMDVHVIPSLNPDGYAYSWTNDRLWRKTRSGPYNSAGLCSANSVNECYGTDPNRNFPFHWAEASTSPCPCSDTFPGPKPFSEPEAVNLAKHMRANGQNIRGYLSLHSMSEVIMHAWNYAPNVDNQMEDELQELGEQMAKAIVGAGGTKFPVGSGPNVLYAASGSSQDFASHLGVKYAYTIELTRGYGFVYPEKLINSYAEIVLPGIQVLAQKVAN